MARQLTRRLLLGLGTLLIVSAIVFSATNVLPGDAARAILGRTATPQAVENLRAELGLSGPIVVRYGTWLLGVLSGDLGKSFVSHRPVWVIVEPRLSNTLLLLFVTSLISIPLSFALGILMAIKRGDWFDNVMNGFLITAAGVPEFVFAILLVLFLSTHVFHLLPPTAIIPGGQTILQNPHVLVLPVATLSLAVLPYLARLVRGSLTEALASEYVVMARLKGLPPHVILFRHALRNSLIPGIQASALTLAYILGGAVVVEVIFQYPGLGSALQQAVGKRDIFTIQAIVLIFATGYIIFNLAADVLTLLMTPRLRTP